MSTKKKKPLKLTLLTGYVQACWILPEASLSHLMGAVRLEMDEKIEDLFENIKMFHLIN